MDEEKNTAPQPKAPERYFALEQLTDKAQTLRLVAQALPVYRAQTEQQLAGGNKAQAYEIYQVLERQRDIAASLLRDTRPYLLELEHPLADAAQALSAQLSAFNLMTRDYSKLTAALDRFAGSLPNNQTTDAAIIGRLMNNVRLGHYPTDLEHVGLIARAVSFPARVTANLLDPCCGTGAAIMRFGLGNDCRCYGVELDEARAETAQKQLYRVGFGSYFSSHVSPGGFHAVFLNPPYLSVLSEKGSRSRDEKRFLIESIPALAPGGLMAYVVPYYRLTMDICQILCDSFTQVSIHRFLDGEFKKFKQVVVMGLKKRRREFNQAEAEELSRLAGNPAALPTIDLLEPGRYALPASALRVETFRGAVFNEEELARQLAASRGFDRLFAKSRLDSEPKRPPLPLSISQVGLIGGSGLINGLMECDYPHIIKGRIVKEKSVSATENFDSYGKRYSTEYRETISNRMIFNILTPQGFYSLA